MKDFIYNNRKIHPLQTSISSINKADRRPIAEQCLVILRDQCKSDLMKGETVLTGGYEFAGKYQIVADYLMWCKRFESHVHPGFYRARIEEIKNLIDTVQND